MFWTRLLSGIVLLAIALATFSFGNVFLAVPLWLISLIAYRELTKALKCATDEKKFNALEWIGFVGVTAYYATEIDKYAIQDTMHNYPETVQLGDAFQVRDDGWKVEGMEA